MARKERSVKNSFTAVIKYVIKLLLQFILRTIIIYQLGVEFVGLDSLYANIISMLSLAELGIGSAIVFSMYKPIAENDIEKLRSLNALYKKMYLVIMGVVAVAGVLMLPFIKFFIHGEVPDGINIYVVYIVFLLNTIVSYFGASKRSLIFAHQRNDIENNILTTQIVLMSVVQILLLIIFKNYYLYVITIPIFTLLESVMVVIVANKMFPDIIKGKANPLDNETKTAIKKNILATACHQIGSVVVLSTDNLLISKFFGLSILGSISNYILIYSAVSSLVHLFLNALQASVGNLIATTKKDEVYKYYKMFNSGFAFATGFCAISLLCLYQDFIAIWVGSIDPMITIWVVVSIVIKFYVSHMRSVTMMFKNSAGLMWNDRFKPIIESILNITFSILFIKLFGLAGVFVGTIVSTILMPTWVEPFVLYKNYFNKNLVEYFKCYIRDVICFIIAGAITVLCCCFIPTGGIWWFALKTIICAIVALTTLIILYLCSKDFKNLIKTGKLLLKNLKNNKKKEQR